MTTPIPDYEFTDWIQHLFPPHKRIMAAIIVEEKHRVLIKRCTLEVEGLEFTAPGRWDVMLINGDFDGQYLDTCVELEEAIALCDCLEIEYTVEF